MEIKILQVFYGKDGLPYKDKDRQVHFPIAGTGFLGASNTTKIKFYYDELDNLDETTWVAVSKLPNGKVGSRVLESHLDEELNEHYALLELDNYYTQYKGDVFISLQGYQGGVDFDYDEENSQYEIHGTPTIAATGSIKFTINYANRFVGSGETDNINFQRILAALGTKLGMRAYSEHVEELPSEGSPDVFYVVNDDPNNPNIANIYVWNENTRHYIWVGDNTLDLGEYYTKEKGEQFESDIDNRVTSVENELSSVAQGSPKGVYATLSDLETAYPTGTTGIYVVSANGHWYYWNGSAWTDGGVYQAIEINDFSITTQKLSNDNAIILLFRGLFSEWYNGIYDGTTGELTPYPFYYVSKKLPFNDITLLDNELFKSYNGNFISLWNDDVYVGVYRYGKWYNPQNEEITKPAFNIVAVQLRDEIDRTKYIDLSINTLISLQEKDIFNTLPFFLIDKDLTFTDGYWDGATGLNHASETHKKSEKIKLSYIPILNKIGSDLKFVSCWKNSVYVGYLNLDTNEWYKGSDQLLNAPEFDEIAFNVTYKDSNDIEIVGIKYLYEKLSSGALKSFWAEKKIGFLGDSITYGAYRPVGGSYASEVAEKPYPTIVAETLDATSINYGVSGTSISATSPNLPQQAFVNRYSNMSNDLDLVVVMGGINDHNTNVELGTIADTTDVSFYGALNVLCNGLINKYPSKRIVFITPLLSDYATYGEGPNALGYTVEQYRQAIIDVAQNKYGLAVISGKSVGLSPFNSTWRATYIVDGLHPNPIGHELIGKNIARMLNGK